MANNLANEAFDPLVNFMSLIVRFGFTCVNQLTLEDSEQCDPKSLWLYENRSGVDMDSVTSACNNIMKEQGLDQTKQRFNFKAS